MRKEMKSSAIRLFWIILFGLSATLGFAQNNNIKFSASPFLYQGVSFAYERKIANKTSLNIQGGIYNVSWFDFSSIDPFGAPPRTDKRLHLDIRRYLARKKSDMLYGPFLFTYFGIVKWAEQVEEPWLYTPEKYEYIDYKYTAGLGFGNKSKISRKSNIYLEYGFAPGFGYVNGDIYSRYHYYFEVRIIIAFCIGF